MFPVYPKTPKRETHGETEGALQSPFAQESIYQELSLMTEREILDPFLFIQLLCGLEIQLILCLKNFWLKQELQLRVLRLD